MTTTKNASDNVSIIIVPQSDSKLIALNEIGQIIWNTEISGALISEIHINGKSAFFLTENSENLQNIYLESISIETGVILWRKEIDAKNKNNLSILMDLNSNDDIQILQENTPIHQFNLKGVKQPISPQIKKIDHLTPQTSSQSGNVYFNKKRQILVIDKLSKIIQLDETGTNKIWTFRMGAGIDSIKETKDQYLFTSLDNYIYCISIKSGKLLWKKRMEGRTKAELIEGKNQLVSSVINGRNTIFTEIQKGKTSNQVLLDGDSYFLNQPLIIDDLVVLTTNKGIVAYSLGLCKK